MIAILIFFFHTGSSLCSFIHFSCTRYASHQMYDTSKGWERVFYFCTWFFQGSSYLIPRAYGVMHRMHHEYSDTEHDPHSPHFFKDVWHMMTHTREIYAGFVTGTRVPDPPVHQRPAAHLGCDGQIRRFPLDAFYMDRYLYCVLRSICSQFMVVPAAADPLPGRPRTGPP